jgi:hypothetical protein
MHAKFGDFTSANALGPDVSEQSVPQQTKLKRLGCRQPEKNSLGAKSRLRQRDTSTTTAPDAVESTFAAMISSSAPPAKLTWPSATAVNSN